MNIKIGIQINQKKRGYEVLADYVSKERNAVMKFPLEKEKISDNATNEECSQSPKNEDNAENINYFVDEEVISNADLLYDSVPVFRFPIERLIMHFDIMPIVKLYGRKIMRNEGFMFSDDKYPLTNTSKITKGSFARTLNQWCEENKITKKGSLDLLTIMHNGFGNVVRLPVQKLSNVDEKDNDIKDDVSTQSLEILTSQTGRSTMEDYDHPISRFFAFHQCFNDCTVFVGDSSKSFQCEVCSALRFRPCV